MRKWRDRGRSVLFISHRLGEVMAICDRATVLRDGRTVAELNPRAGGHEQLVQAMMGAAAEEVEVDTGHRPAASRTDTAALETRGLGHGTQVDDVDLILRPGEVLGLAALEGQGQDVLFDLLAGIKRPQRGEILVAGKPLRARSPFDAIRRGVVLVPSDRLMALLPQRPLRENLTTGLYNRVRRWGPLRRADEQRRVRAAIDRLAIDTRAGSQVRRLSGGNQQKVTIGRWLAAGFTTLLCFDPTRGIDVGTKRQIYELLRELAAEGAAVLLYTSELQEIPLVCDRVAVMYGGRVVHERDATGADEEGLLTAAHGIGGERAA
jgi:ribose transport system ATP-binding protein